MCVHVCVCVYMCVYVCERECGCVRVCLLSISSFFNFILIWCQFVGRTTWCVYACVCGCACVYACVCVCMCVWMCVCVRESERISMCVL